MAWAAFKHDVDTYFFWHGSHWLHNRQKQGDRQQNVWADPITVRQPRPAHKPVEDQGYLNGDGVLMYPGEEKAAPRRGPGHRGPRRPACSSRTCAAGCRTTST